MTAKPGAPARLYVDTLAELRREFGATRPICLLLGADAFLDLATWSRWHEIFALAHVVVAHRPGFAVDTWQTRMPQPLAREILGAADCSSRWRCIWPAAAAWSWRRIAALDISATLIRDAVARGASPRYLATGLRSRLYSFKGTLRSGH